MWDFLEYKKKCFFFFFTLQELDVGCHSELYFLVYVKSHARIPNPCRCVFELQHLLETKTSLKNYSAFFVIQNLIVLYGLIGRCICNLFFGCSNIKKFQWFFIFLIGSSAAWLAGEKSSAICCWKMHLGLKCEELTVQCSAVQCRAVQCSPVQCTAVQCTALDWTALLSVRLSQEQKLGKL